MMQNEEFSCFLHGLIYQICQTNCLTSSHFIRLRVLRISGFLEPKEKQTIDRIFRAIKDKKITLINYSRPLNNLLNYQEYKMLYQNQPAEYLCKLFNQLVETHTLSETNMMLLQQAQNSHKLNLEEEQIIKRIFYSIKRGRIKVVRTLRSDERLYSSDNKKKEKYKINKRGQS